jgi:hypothetical protein
LLLLLPLPQLLLLCAANEINGVRLSRKGKGVPPAPSCQEQDAGQELMPRRGKGYVRPPSEEVVLKRQLGSSAPVSMPTIMPHERDAS